MAILLHRRAAPRHWGQSEVPGLAACQGRREQRGPQTPPEQDSATALLCSPSPGGPQGATAPPAPLCADHPPLTLQGLLQHWKQECRKRQGMTPDRAPGVLQVEPQLTAQGPASLRLTHECCRNPKQESNLAALVHVTGNMQICSGDYTSNGGATGLQRPAIRSKLCFSLAQRPPQQGTPPWAPHIHCHGHPKVFLKSVCLQEPPKLQVPALIR